MENVDNVRKTDSVDGSPSVLVVIGSDLQYRSATKALERFDIWVLDSRLRRKQRSPHMALH